MQEDRAKAGETLTLRLIYTTDLHMALGLPDMQPPAGLAALAPVIEQARSERVASILCDVGDVLQGSAFGEWLARDDTAASTPHPLYEMMNTIGYDAATLGNHDFDFGLEHLDKAVSGLNAPMVCGNLERLDGGVQPRPFVLHEVVQDGVMLRVGITGVLPERVMRWNRHHLADKVEVIDPEVAMRALVPQMRAAGADIVIVLAHTGIVPDDHPDADEQAALRLGRIAGVDALLCGHQHLTFPGPDLPPDGEIDPVGGTLAGTPAIMPGWSGQQLGLLDLSLRVSTAGWQVIGHEATFRNPQDPDPALLTPSAPLRAQHTRWEDEPLSWSPVPLTTHFGSVIECRAVQVLQAAMRNALTKSGYVSDLPVLAAAAPGKMGGRSGPGGYTCVAAGALTRKAVGDLCPFPNRVSLIGVDGALLRDWLEMACLHLNVLTASESGQSLTNDAFPGYNFDSIEGLSYVIDPMRPVGERIRDLSHDGRPVAEADRFAVLVSSFRASGGGGFTMLDRAEVLIPDLCGLSDAVEAYLTDHDEIHLGDVTWQMATHVPVTARLWTGATLEDSAPRQVRHVTRNADGWEEWEVTLAPLPVDQSAA